MEIELAATILTAPSMKELAVSSQSGSSWKRDGKSYRCSGYTLSVRLTHCHFVCVVIPSGSSSNGLSSRGITITPHHHTLSLCALFVCLLVIAECLSESECVGE